MSTKKDKHLILSEIKSAYNLRSKAEFARYLGIAPSTLSTWYERNSFDYDILFAKCVDINANFLLSGEGQVKKSPVNTEIENDFMLRTDTRKEAQSVPLYNFQAAASLITLFEGHQNIIDYITIPNLPKSDGAIYVTGDSMYPLIKSGDIAVYKKLNDIVEGMVFGEMHIISALIDGDLRTVVKYVQKSENGEDWIKLVSQNTHHAPKDIRIKQIKAMALIKATVRINSMT